MKTAMKNVLMGVCLGSVAWFGQVNAEMVKAYEGWKLYTSTCFLCHGNTGKGDGPLAKSLKLSPADFGKRRAQLDRLSDRELMREIQGAKGHLEGMPKWGTILSEPQIDAVVAYVRYLSKAEHPLEGNPELGRQLYGRYCISCHGESGKGDGVMASLVQIRPADHTDAGLMNRMGNKEISQIILNGDSKNGYMPAWSGVLSKADSHALVSYIRLLSSK